MTVVLRPMSLGEILDRTFQIYKGRFLVFLGIAVMPLTGRMALTLLGMLFDGVIGQTTLTFAVKQLLTGRVDWFASRIAGSFLYYLIWPVFAILASRIFVHDKVEIRSALRECLARWRSWLVMGGVFWLIESELPRQLRTSRYLWRAWAGMPYWLSSIISMVEGFVLIAPLCLSIAIWPLEKLRARDAIARSWSLSRRSYGKMFLAWILTYVISWGIAATLGGLIFVAIRLIVGSGWDPYSPGYARFAVMLPAYLSSALTAALFPIAITLIYYDQRIRLEGFDIEWMMETAGMTAPVPAQTTDAEIARAPVGEAQG